MKALKILRVLVAACVFTLVTLFFLGLGGGFGLLEKIQIVPALLACSLTPFFAWFAMTVLFGRVYCSMACPLGILQDLLGRLARVFGRRKFEPRPDRPVVRFAAGMAFALLVVLGGSALAGLVDPYSLFGRLASALFQPVAEWANNWVATTVGTEGPFVLFTREVFIRSVSGFAVAASALVLLFLLVAWKGRLVCNTVCPVGAMLGVLSKKTVFRLVIDPAKCVKCGRCSTVCKALCLDGAKQVVDNARCVRCFDCAGVCPKGAISFTAARPVAKPAEEDHDRRAFIAAVATASAVAGVVGSSLGVVDRRAWPKDTLPPPGADPNRFRRLCTGCGLCVAKCPKKVLVPAGFSAYGPLGFMLPKMDFTHGFCDPNCTVCSEVCPTGALRPLEAKAKAAWRVGVATYDRAACLVCTEKEKMSCGLCARRCPSQAITLKEEEIKIGEKNEKVQLPVIEKEKCTGCGACANYCPAQAMKVVRRLLVVCAFLLAGGAQAAARDWFGATFRDYTTGETLSSAGTTGGAWQPLAAGTMVTNVFDGVRNGIAIDTASTTEVTFKPVAPTGGEVERIDFSLYAEGLGGIDIEDFDGAAGLSPALLSGGQVGFNGFTADGWIELTGEGVAPQEGTWIDGRIELRTVENLRLVSYLVKKDDTWVRLANKAGATWFRTRPSQTAAGISSVSFTGSGRFSDFSGQEDAGEPLRVYRWVGGDEGDWNTAANWTVDGAAAEAAPAQVGDLAVVDGEVVLTRGEENGTVKDLLVGFSDDGAYMMGGRVKTELELDVSRPRIGKALTATYGTLFGLAPTYSFAWTRAGTDKNYASTPFAKTGSYKPTASDLEHWIKVVAKDGEKKVLEKEFFFSRLPVIYLTTDDHATPSKSKEEHTGTLYAQGNDDWKSLYDGKMTIKVRGNSTASYPKKPWKIKLDKKTKMFDIPKSKHWVLLANYNDQSMLRNKLAYDFANEIGSLGMKSTWVECVLNGAWQGTYQFCEHIRIAGDRVDIHDWEDDAGSIAEAFAAAHGLTDDQAATLATQLEQNFTWVTSDSFSFYDATNRVTLTGRPSEVYEAFTQDYSGGYLFEFSEEYDELTKFTTSSGVLGVKTMLKSPEYLNSNDTMLRYCKTFFQNYWDACTSVDGYSKEGKYIGDYCDFESMVNYWLVMELFGNCDAVKKSRYAYKDQGGKLVWGPVWDFDWGVGSPRVSADGTGWKCQSASDKVADAVYKEWTDNPEFCTRLYTRYWQVRDQFARLLGSDGLIATYTNRLVEACHANSIKWNTDYNKGAGNFEADVSRLVTFLTQRLPWLDRQFASVETLMASVQQSTCTRYYTADKSRLPIAFSGLNRNQTLYTGRSLRTTFRPGGTSVTGVSVFVNGWRVFDKKAPTSGLFDAEIPAEAFTAAVGEPNCVAFIAYNSSGTVLGRNYALVTQVPSGTIFFMR